MVTHQVLLVEHGTISTEEAVLQSLLLLLTLNRDADVEDLERIKIIGEKIRLCHLASTLYISVITVGLVIATEGVRVVGADGEKDEKDSEDDGGDCVHLLRISSAPAGRPLPLPSCERTREPPIRISVRMVLVTVWSSISLCYSGYGLTNTGPITASPHLYIFL